MSASPVYGIREYDLATDRQSERDYELIQLPKAKYISMVSVPNAAYLRFGSRTSPRLDLRDYSELEADEAFGTAYLENPPSSGSLKLLFGVTLTSDSGDDVSISSINDAVDVSDRPGRDLGTVDVSDPVAVSSDAARSIGKARVMDSTETLVDPSTDGSTTPDKREVANWSAGTLSVAVDEPQTTDITSFSHVLAGGTETLPDNAVPAGVNVVVQAEPTNTDDVRIGEPTNPVMSLSGSGTISYDVTNTNQIGVDGTADDQVNVTFEVN